MRNDVKKKKEKRTIFPRPKLKERFSPEGDSFCQATHQTGFVQSLIYKEAGTISIVQFQPGLPKKKTIPLY